MFNFSTKNLIFKNHIVLNLLIQSNIDITKIFNDKSNLFDNKQHFFYLLSSL